jgi:DNA invertase Pin-like site-specific DNA recombinase
MKTFAYLRVSGHSQIDGDGERRQREAISEFCRASRLELSPETFFDAAVSGTVDGADRPALLRLMTQAQPGDCMVVERLDRLARELMVQEFILKECRQRGIRVYAADQGEPIDQSGAGADPTRILIRQILGALAEWEKSALVLKLHKGLNAKRARGEYCGGNTPYGTQPGEWEILNAMRALREAGENDNTIAGTLNAGNYRTRTGKLWKQKGVRQILNGWGLRSHRKEMAS